MQENKKIGMGYTEYNVERALLRIINQVCASNPAFCYYRCPVSITIIIGTPQQLQNICMHVIRTHLLYLNYRHETVVVLYINKKRKCPLFPDVLVSIH